MDLVPLLEVRHGVYEEKKTALGGSPRPVQLGVQHLPKSSQTKPPPGGRNYLETEVLQLLVR